MIMIIYIDRITENVKNETNIRRKRHIGKKLESRLYQVLWATLADSGANVAARPRSVVPR